MAQEGPENRHFTKVKSTEGRFTKVKSLKEGHFAKVKSREKHSAKVKVLKEGRIAKVKSREGRFAKVKSIENFLQRSSYLNKDTSL